MKIPNNDPPEGAKSRYGYRRGHPSMPDDVFCMLICGPSNSGKTNILVHMLRAPLLFLDKIYFFSKNVHQHKYVQLLQDFESLSDEVGYDVDEGAGDEITPLDELPTDNQKIVMLRSTTSSARRTRTRS